MTEESDLSLRPRPGETPADVIERVTRAALRPVQAEERWRVWVDDARCVLFRLHPSGLAEITTRAEPGDTWGPPITLTEEVSS